MLEKLSNCPTIDLGRKKISNTANRINYTARFIALMDAMLKSDTWKRPMNMGRDGHRLSSKLTVSHRCHTISVSGGTTLTSSKTE